MKKTLIASAIAAVTLSTTTFAMDPASELAARLDSMPTVYGNIQLFQKYVDDGNNSATSFEDGGSTLGVKHSHEIMPGLEGILKIEFEFAADGDGEGIDGFDEAYFGVKGDIGTLIFGSEDTVYEWIDVVDIFEQVGGNGEIAPDSESNTLHYYSPTLGETVTVGLTKNFDNSGKNDDTDGSNYQLAVKADVGPATLAAAYAIGDDDAEDTFGLAAEVGIGENVTVAGQYESQKDNADYFALLGVFAAGPNQFAASYEFLDPDADGASEVTYITLQALHNLSDNMYVFVEYMFEDVDDGDELDTLAVGGAYAF